MPNKYYLRHDRTAVKPEMNEPEWPGFYESDIQIIEYYNQRTLLWDQHIKSLPALDVDPDYLKRLSPGWFEGEERYEVLNDVNKWVVVDESWYSFIKEHRRRLTIVAPQEAENGQEGEVIGKFAGKIEDAGYKVVFGLQDHHIKRINEETISKWEKPERAIFSSHFWEDLGKEFSWHPLTLALYYFDHIRPATPQDADRWEAVYSKFINEYQGQLPITAGAFFRFLVNNKYQLAPATPQPVTGEPRRTLL